MTHIDEQVQETEADEHALRVTVRLTGEARRAFEAIDSRVVFSAGDIVGMALILFDHMSRPDDGRTAADALEAAVAEIEKYAGGDR